MKRRMRLLPFAKQKGSKTALPDVRHMVFGPYYKFLHRSLPRSQMILQQLGVLVMTYMPVAYGLYSVGIKIVTLLW